MKKTGRQFLVFLALLVLFAQVPCMNQRVSAAAKTTTEKKTTVKTTKKKNGLYKEGNGKFCYYQNNKRIKNTWKTIKGGKYYFDKNGYALIGSSKVGRTLYLFRADGKLYKRNRNGFAKVLGNTYYVLKSGELRTGWIGLGNSIYYADSRGRILRNATREGVKLNKDGKAVKVTQRVRLHAYARNVLVSVTNSRMTRREKLKACYNYLAYSGRFYYYAPADPNLSKKGWYIGCASKMLGQGRGNCYGFSCAFAALARELGYTPYLMCARAPGVRDQAPDGYTRHCWVLINNRHYDPQGSYAGWSGCYGTRNFRTPYKQLRKVRFD